MCEKRINIDIIVAGNRVINCLDRTIVTRNDVQIFARCYS